DIKIHPWMLVEDVVLVALHPRIDQHGLVAEGIELPWRVRGHQLRHALEQPGTLGRVGKLSRLVVELVVFGELESREIGHARMRTVEQIQESESLGGVADVT